MSDLSAANVVLTGLPRSGTTLACHLLNQLPDVVALHEPMNVGRLHRLRGAQSRCRAIADFFDATRRSIVETGLAPSKVTDGRVPDNPVNDFYSASGLRHKHVTHGQVSIDKDVRDDFVLTIKHPAAFTALLPHLVEYYPSFAVVRNPLSVLSSWNTVALNINRGRLPIGESLDRRLAVDLRGIVDTVDRQIRILSWFFEKYSRTLPDSAIIRYEELIASRGRALAAIVPDAARLDVDLRSKNRNELYDRETMRRLADRLLAADGAFWSFYSRESVVALVEDAAADSS